MCPETASYAPSGVGSCKNCVLEGSITKFRPVARSEGSMVVVAPVSMRAVIECPSCKAHLTVVELSVRLKLEMESFLCSH